MGLWMCSGYNVIRKQSAMPSCRSICSQLGIC
jgi:hypothetical protein